MAQQPGQTTTLDGPDWKRILFSSGKSSSVSHAGQKTVIQMSLSHLS